MYEGEHAPRLLDYHSVTVAGRAYQRIVRTDGLQAVGTVALIPADNPADLALFLAAPDMYGALQEARAELAYPRRWSTERARLRRLALVDAALGKADGE